MKTIDQLLDDLVQREGGYVDNPADKGGPTNFGITEQRARADGYQGDMRSLPLDTAKAIYRKDYWIAPHFWDVAQRYATLGAYLFDTGVNMGPKAAATFLQRVLNVLNRGATDYPDVPADGDIGALTLHALDGFRKVRGAGGETALLIGLEALRGSRYIAIAEANPSQETFELGWLNRVQEAAS